MLGSCNCFLLILPGPHSQTPDGQSSDEASDWTENVEDKMEQAMSDIKDSLIKMQELLPQVVLSSHKAGKLQSHIKFMELVSKERYPLDVLAHIQSNFSLQQIHPRCDINTLKHYVIGINTFSSRNSACHENFTTNTRCSGYSIKWT